MKKTLLIVMLLAATAARAFDFRATATTGQWVYYSVVEGNSVKVVNPDWDSHTQPTGTLQIPATVTDDNGGTTYNVTAIDNEAFKFCDGLTAVIVPEGVTSIGRMAFAYCTTLDSIALPSTLDYIGSMAFTGTAFFSGNHLTAEGFLVAGAYLIGARTALTGSVTVPEGIQGLGNMAFYACGTMERIILPDGLRFIGENAFQECLMIDTVEMHSAVPPALASNAFTNVQDFAVLVPCHSASAYQADEPWNHLTIVEHCHPADPAGIAPTAVGTFTVTTVDGGLAIAGDGNRTFSISDIMGRRVADSKGGFVALQRHGIYIVSTPGSKATKAVY